MKLNASTIRYLAQIDKDLPKSVSDAYGINWEMPVTVCRVRGKFTAAALNSTITAALDPFADPQATHFDFAVICVTRLIVPVKKEWWSRASYDEHFFEIDPTGKIILKSSDNRRTVKFSRWPFFSRKCDFDAYRKQDGIETLIIAQSVKCLRPDPKDPPMNTYTRYTKNGGCYCDTKELYTWKQPSLSSVCSMGNETALHLDASGYSVGLARIDRKLKAIDLRAERKRAALRAADTSAMIREAENNLTAAITAYRDALDRLIDAQNGDCAPSDSDLEAIGRLFGYDLKNSVRRLSEIRRFGVVASFNDLDDLQYFLKIFNRNVAYLSENAAAVLPVPSAAE